MRIGGSWFQGSQSFLFVFLAFLVLFRFFCPFASLSFSCSSLFSLAFFLFSSSFSFSSSLLLLSTASMNSARAFTRFICRLYSKEEGFRVRCPNFLMRACRSLSCLEQSSRTCMTSSTLLFPLGSRHISHLARSAHSLHFSSRQFGTLWISAFSYSC